MGPMKLEFISESVSIWSDFTVDLEQEPKIPTVPFLCNQTESSKFPYEMNSCYSRREEDLEFYSPQFVAGCVCE